MKGRSGKLLGGCVLLLLCAGCATVRTPAQPPARQRAQTVERQARPGRCEIPLGKWSGTGTCVVEKWPTQSDETEPPAAATQGWTYSTYLKIEPDHERGAGSVKMEILSEHAEGTPPGGDRTHLILRLEPHSSLANGDFTLYHLTWLGYSPNEDPPEGYLPLPTPGAVTCMRDLDQIVLRIHYMPGFVDTFLFQDDLLYKQGALFFKEGLGTLFIKEKGAFVMHWSEFLRQEP